LADDQEGYRDSDIKMVKILVFNQKLRQNHKNGKQNQDVAGKAGECSGKGRDKIGEKRVPGIRWP